MPSFILAGAPEKRVPSVPGLWRLDLLMDTTEDGSFRPPGILGVQMSRVVRQNRLFARNTEDRAITEVVIPWQRYYCANWRTVTPNQTLDGEPSRRLTFERSPS